MKKRSGKSAKQDAHPPTDLLLSFIAYTYKSIIGLIKALMGDIRISIGLFWHYFLATHTSNMSPNSSAAQLSFIFIFLSYFFAVGEGREQACFHHLLCCCFLCHLVVEHRHQRRQRTPPPPQAFRAHRPWLLWMVCLQVPSLQIVSRGARSGH